MNEAPSPTAARRLGKKLDEALDAVHGAASYARSTYQTQLFQVAEALMSLDDGMPVLYERAHRFDDAGVFAGGPWEHPERLLPPLVAGSLRAAGVYPVVETLSELRMLAIATGRADSAVVPADEAREFLDEVMALNLQWLFPVDTEASRIDPEPHRASNERLFSLLADTIGLDNVRDQVVAEIEAVCAQRPIQTRRVRGMIQRASRIPADTPGTGAQRLHRFRKAIEGPSPRAAEAGPPQSYRGLLRGLSPEELGEEARAFGESMTLTGLVSEHHAVLLRHLMRRHADLAPQALGLSGVGAASLDHHLESARRLVNVAIHPSTAQSIYGLARVLDRGLLQRREIRHGLTRIVQLDLHPEVRQQLLDRKRQADGVPATAMLLAGVISVLGQPLGVGQGNNPTCQAARGISLWAQHSPGYLLNLLVAAAQDGDLVFHFEGTPLHSSHVARGVAETIDLDLDPVSLVLVPHLDRIYDQMMRRVVLRGEDSHKWVNPALYGHYVPHGFATAFRDVAQTTVADFGDFVRRFYATHHPAYNDGRRLMYPNPLGLCVTDSHQRYLGPHAVSLQRVAEDPSGQLRAYFYNPNNEGRQDWGSGVRPSVHGHGEREGESSLPFHELASRIYAFHYRSYEVGDGYAVPDDEVARVEKMARASWGQAFVWATPL